ncbi:MAG: alpha/beta fold hydrolase [Acidimicrobiales bacterium]|nr:alpha/beta fold hydrolase [Acidimicrobiales bacterium]MCB9392841.1 alpha/beta fold hydrolase [Acidimicrobiaceae bacterium]
MRLNVVRGGVRGAVPIVFLHGLGSSAATWSQCLELLADTFDVAAVDLLGHGGSPVPDDPDEYTRDRALADLDDVLADLFGPADGSHRPVLVGHSLGGYLALAHAITRPGVDRGLVVLNTGPGFRDPDKREAWNERSRRNAHKFGVAPQVTDLNLHRDALVMDRIAELTVPVLVLVGDRDRPEYQASGAWFERRLPDGRVRLVEGGEHSMHEATHADVVAAMIREFVLGLTS